jgi:hypothetical protein
MEYRGIMLAKNNFVPRLSRRVPLRCIPAEHEDSASLHLRACALVLSRGSAAIT